MLRHALLALILVLAVVKAQDSCNATTTCVKLGQNCGTSDLPPGSTRVCTVGAQCQSDTCARQPRLNEACSASGIPCFDDDWSGVACVNNFCRYANVFFPGERCRDSDSSYANGGCAFGSCANGRCTFIDEGGNCSSSPSLCGPGLFCNNQGTCAARLRENVNCTALIQCQPTLVCTSRGGTSSSCQEPFTQAVSQGCDSDLDCSAGLFCFNRVCIQPTVEPSGDCAGPAGVSCGPNAFCVCDSRIRNDELVEEGTGHCVRREGNVRREIDQIRSYQRCASDKSCQDLWFAQEILSGFSSIPTSPNQCAGSCSHDRIFGVDLDEGDCPFSASIGLMPAAVLLTLMALLALF